GLDALFERFLRQTKAAANGVERRARLLGNLPERPTEHDAHRQRLALLGRELSEELAKHVLAPRRFGFVARRRTGVRERGRGSFLSRRERARAPARGERGANGDRGRVAGRVAL